MYPPRDIIIYVLKEKYLVGYNFKSIVFVFEEKSKVFGHILINNKILNRNNLVKSPNMIFLLNFMIHICPNKILSWVMFRIYFSLK